MVSPGASTLAVAKLLLSPKLSAPPNPGTDAEIVAVHVVLPKGKAQDVLDDLVLKGRLRMKSGQHGRCYVVLEGC